MRNGKVSWGEGEGEGEREREGEGVGGREREYSRVDIHTDEAKE